MKKDLFDLTGQVGVVVGATGVLGGAISQALAVAGASVAVLGRNMFTGLRLDATGIASPHQQNVPQPALKTTNCSLSHSTFAAKQPPVVNS